MEKVGITLWTNFFKKLNIFCYYFYYKIYIILYIILFLNKGKNEIKNYNVLHSVRFPNNGIESLFCSVVKYQNNQIETLLHSIPLRPTPFHSVQLHSVRFKISKHSLRGILVCPHYILVTQQFT